MSRPDRGGSWTERLKRAGLVLGLFVALVALWIVASARPADPDLAPEEGEPTVTVYVTYNWMHADLVVPREALAAASDGPGRAALALVEDAPWVALGWGDAAYYRERGLSPRRAVDFPRSMLVPDNPAVVHMEPRVAEQTPETVGRHVLRLTLSEAGFRRLAARFDASVALHEGAAVDRGRGRRPGSRFVLSTERGDMTYTCNDWIAELLHAAGAPTNRAVAAVTHALAWDLRLRAEAEPVEGERRDQTYAQTPPTHSGVYDPVDDPARAAGTLVFETWRVRLSAARDLETAPAGLAPAAPWAERLDLPPDGLVEHRRVLAETGAGPGLCGPRPVRRLILGFADGDSGRRDGRYEIAAAAFADAAEPCAVLRWVQR